MTEHYQKGVFVMNYLQELGMNMTTVGEAISDNNLEKSYRLILENPRISKKDFLDAMELEEWED